MNESTVFVPNGDSRTDTAVLLVGTAEEHGVDQRSIKATVGGFWVTEELADLVYAEVDEEPEPEPEPEPVKTPTKTSGNRAAKSSTDKKE